MIELTKAEENRLGGFKEQLASIKKNVAIANSELENIYAKKSLEESSFAIKQKQIAMEIDKLNKEKDSLVEFVQSEEKRIQSESNHLHALKDEFEKYKTKEELEIFAKHEEADAIIGDSENRLESLQALIEQTDKETKKVEALLVLKGEMLLQQGSKEAELRRNIGLYEKDLARINLERENAAEIAGKEITRLQKEIIDAEKKIASEKQKVIIPRKNLEDEIEAFEVKKRQLQIIYNRTKKAWEQIYPGQNLDNVIKVW